MSTPISQTGPQGRAPETVVARLRPHGRAMFWPSVVLIADLAALGYLGTVMPEAWQRLVVLGAAVLVAVLLVLLPLLRWLSTHYTLTTRRIVIRHGVLVRTRQELLHSRGYDVTVRKGAIQSLFRSGDILINTGLDHPIRLRDVPGADLVQAALHDLMEPSLNPVAARRQQSRADGGAPDGGVR